MSEDGSRILWSGRRKSGVLSVRLLTKGRRDGAREHPVALDGCSAPPGRAAGGVAPDSGQGVDAHTWDASGFRILHPRDPYPDVWGSTDLTPVAHAPPAARQIASAMFADGSWVALLYADGQMQFVATHCPATPPPAAGARDADGAYTRARRGTTARGAAWQVLGPQHPPAPGSAACGSATLVATGCATKRLIILPGRDCGAFSIAQPRGLGRRGGWGGGGGGGGGGAGGWGGGGGGGGGASAKAAGAVAVGLEVRCLLAEL